MINIYYKYYVFFVSSSVAKSVLTLWGDQWSVLGCCASWRRLGWFGRVGWCAWKEFIMGSFDRLRHAVAWNESRLIWAACKIFLSQSERVNSYPRKIHYQHATTTGAWGVTNSVQVCFFFLFFSSNRFVCTSKYDIQRASLRGRLPHAALDQGKIEHENVGGQRSVVWRSLRLAHGKRAHTSFFWNSNHNRKTVITKRDNRENHKQNDERKPKRMKTTKTAQRKQKLSK